MAEEKDGLKSNLREIVYTGVGVSPGIAIGTAYVHNQGVISVQKYRIESDDVEKEQERVVLAAEKTARQLKILRAKAEKMPGDSGEELIYLLDAYTHMLRSSRLVRGAIKRIAIEKINAESAVQAEISSLVEAFEMMDDAYLSARLDDIKNVGSRIVRNLGAKTTEPFANLPDDTIILANELAPADTAMLDPEKVKGFATLAGSTLGHTALLARSLGLPAAVSVPNLLDVVDAGDKVIIDGTYGTVIISPTPATLKKYENYRQDFLEWRESLKGLRDLEAITQDSVKINLKGNIDLPSEIRVLSESGAEGVGLMRTEYMFMNRASLPREEEQYKAIREVIRVMGNKPVTIRTLDVGGDKPSDLINSGSGSALGMRGIRCSLKWQDLFEEQLSAIYRASYYGNVRVLFPMISSVSEVVEAIEVKDRVVARLKSEGTKLPEKLPEIGIMIEVPSAALCADAMAKYVDFFSIGTNDLTQYTLALDRSDSRLSHLFNPMHPAVIKLIHMTAEAGKKHGKPVSICGEIAANNNYTELLVGLGVTELSMPAINVPTVKEKVRSLNYSYAVDFANYILSLDSLEDVLKAFEDKNRL